jgi:hypothetical protein
MMKKMEMMIFMTIQWELWVMLLILLRKKKIRNYMMTLLDLHLSLHLYLPPPLNYLLSLLLPPLNYPLSLPLTVSVPMATCVTVTTGGMIPINKLPPPPPIPTEDEEEEEYAQPPNDVSQ